MGNLPACVSDGQALAPSDIAPRLGQRLRDAGFSIPLRPYQTDVTLQVADALAAGRMPLVVLPTGAGKTISAASWIALSFARPEATGQQCLFVSHRTILSENAASTVEAVTPLRVGIVGGGSSDWEADVVCVTIQSLQSDDAWRRIAGMRLRTVIVDEAHRVSTVSYNRFFSRLQELHPDARIIGLTATPIRADGKKLHPFNQVIQGPSLQDLIDLGVLVTPRFFVPVLDGHEERQAALSALASSRLESMNAAAQILDGRRFNAGIVDEWLRRGEGRSTVVFSTTKAHAEHLAAAFDERGITAATVHSSVSDAEQRERLAAYERGEIAVIINPMMLTEGWDSQRTSCLVFARPFASPVAFVQAAGRALRAIDPKRYPGLRKHDAIVLDFADAIGRHGSLDSRGAPNRESGGSGSPGRVYRSCGSCDAAYAGSGPCPECGTCRPDPESVQSFSRDYMAPELREVIESAERYDSLGLPWFQLDDAGPDGLPNTAVCNAVSAIGIVARAAKGRGFMALGKLPNPPDSTYPWPLDAVELCRGTFSQCLDAASSYLREHGDQERAATFGQVTSKRITDLQRRFLKSQSLDPDAGMSAAAASAAIVGAGFKAAYRKRTRRDLSIQLASVRPLAAKERVQA